MQFSRRRLLTQAALPILTASGLSRQSWAAQDLAWAPETRLGINLIYANLWSDGSGHVPIPAKGQHALFIRYGVSFIRGMINWYRRGGVETYTFPDWPFETEGADFAIRKVLSIRSYAQDPSQLEITCEGSSYAPPPGEKIVLSGSLTYPDLHGQVQFPARTPLTLTGSTAGAIDGHYRSIAPSTYRISAGRVLQDAGVIQISNTTALHMNFYKSGRTPRGQITAYVEAANAWMAAGFAFDHAGMHEQLGTLINDYGLDNINVLRKQEWEYFAYLHWDPRKVLISNANEIVWGGKVENRGGEWEGYKTWFRDFAYPEMRDFFPRHTLALGLGNGDSSLGMQLVDWWPSDPNLMLAIHGYLEPGWFPFSVDGSSVEGVKKVLDFIDENARRLRIRHIYWQEFGLKVNAPGRSGRLNELRKMILERGYYACSWGADTDYDYYRVATKKNGLWTPLPDSAGAFGTQ